MRTGTLFMVAAPLVYMVRGQLFVHDKSLSNSQQRGYQLQLTQRVSAALTAFGIFLLLVWAFTAETNGVRILGHRKNDDTVSFLHWGDGLRMVFEMIGRLLVTTVLFSDIVLAMSICHWREERNLNRSQRGEIDMFQLNTILFNAAPVDALPTKDAGSGNVAPPASGFVGDTERMQDEPDEVSSLGEAEDDMSV